MRMHHYGRVRVSPETFRIVAVVARPLRPSSGATAQVIYSGLFIFSLFLYFGKYSLMQLDRSFRLLFLDTKRIDNHM